MSNYMRVENGFEIGGETFVLYSSSDPSTGGGLAAPESSICLVNNGGTAGLYLKDDSGDTDWIKLVKSSELGADTYYSNSSTTTVDWNNGAVQRMTARSGTVTLSFSNPASSRTYTLLVEASGGNITFVFPVGHYTDGAASSDTITSGSIKAYRIHYVNDTYFWDIGAELEDVVAGDPDIVWANVNSNLSVDGNNNINKDTGGSDWNAGATSTKTWASGDCHVDTVVDETNKARFIGFNNVESGDNYSQIDFCALLHRTGTLLTYYKGSQQSSEGSYANGDTIRVAIESGSVVVRKNNTLMHTFSQSPSSSYPVRVDTSFGDNNATLKDVTHSS